MKIKIEANTPRAKCDARWIEMMRMHADTCEMQHSQHDQQSNRICFLDTVELVNSGMPWRSTIGENFTIHEKFISILVSMSFTRLSVNSIGRIYFSYPYSIRTPLFADELVWKHHFWDRKIPYFTRFPLLASFAVYWQLICWQSFEFRIHFIISHHNLPVRPLKVISTVFHFITSDQQKRRFSIWTGSDTFVQNVVRDLSWIAHLLARLTLTMKTWVWIEKQEE